MIIAYISITGNVRRFVENVGMRSVEISYSNTLIEMNEDYIFICPSYDEDLNDVVSEFIDYKNNRKHLKGFCGSGNRNFDKSYCHNAKKLSNKYEVPLITMFEFSGMNDDITRFKKEVNKFESTRTTE